MLNYIIERNLTKEMVHIPICLVKNRFEIRTVPPDGSCLFHALAWNCLKGSKNPSDDDLLLYARELRRRTHETVTDGNDLSDEYRVFFSGNEEGTGNVRTSVEYADALRHSTFYAGDIELHALAHHVIGRSICVFNINDAENIHVKVYNPECWNGLENAYIVTRADMHYDALVYTPLKRVQSCP
jgi:hypothetical protein